MVECARLQAEVFFCQRPDVICRRLHRKAHNLALVGIADIITVFHFGVELVFFQHRLCQIRAGQNNAALAVQHTVYKRGSADNATPFGAVRVGIRDFVAVVQFGVQRVHKVAVCAFRCHRDGVNVVRTAQRTVYVVSNDFSKRACGTVFDNGFCVTRQTSSNRI